MILCIIDLNGIEQQAVVVCLSAFQSFHVFVNTRILGLGCKTFGVAHEIPVVFFSLSNRTAL